MAKTPKAPFANLQKPSDTDIASMSRGFGFKKCKNCGTTIVPSATLCGECLRLQEIGYGPVPRAPHAHAGQDTAQRASYPSGNHFGYRDTIPSRKIDPTRERY